MSVPCESCGRHDDQAQTRERQIQDILTRDVQGELRDVRRTLDYVVVAVRAALTDGPKLAEANRNDIQDLVCSVLASLGGLEDLLERVHDLAEGDLRPAEGHEACETDSEDAEAAEGYVNGHHAPGGEP